MSVEIKVTPWQMHGHMQRRWLSAEGVSLEAAEPHHRFICKPMISQTFAAISGGLSFVAVKCRQGRANQCLRKDISSITDYTILSEQTNFPMRSSCDQPFLLETLADCAVQLVACVHFLLSEYTTEEPLYRNESELALSELHGIGDDGEENCPSCSCTYLALASQTEEKPHKSTT